MFEIIDFDNGDWDDIINSFPNSDIYYLRGYLKGFEIHGDGVPILLYYEDENIRAACSLFKRTIPNSSFYDVITPYGYGGFIFEGDISDDNILKVGKEFKNAMMENGIISGFFRFHPLLSNAKLHSSFMNVIDLGRTIDINLDSRESLFANFTGKNRNMVRKAQKNGIVIEHGRGKELFDKFIKIYNATMDSDNATDYYYFGKEFYDSIDECLGDNYMLFYALYDNKIIAMSIILFINDYVHYHLSGSVREYRNLAPTNLLLCEVANWGVDNGYKRFHLGGGVGSGEDDLYKFKKAFNKNFDNQFSIGKIIFNQEIYDKLVEEVKQSRDEFDTQSKFFPLYRN